MVRATAHTELVTTIVHIQELTLMATITADLAPGLVLIPPVLLFDLKAPA